MAGTMTGVTRIVFLCAALAGVSGCGGSPGGGQRGLAGAAADGPQVAAGTTLPFGEVASVCGVRASTLGDEVSVFPAQRKTWQIYDSKPESTLPRPFYITGFKDNCARTLTAAVVVFGAPSTHELLRYGAPAEHLPYSDTDRAYERVKRQVCRVGPDEPCGDRIDRLERDTVFLSAYENHGTNLRWLNLLLHKGEIVATDLKSGE